MRDDDVLGDPETRLKWRLVAAIAHRISDQGWPLTEVARMTGLLPAELDDVMRGLVRERSLFELMAMLTCLGLSIDMDVFEADVDVGGIFVSWGDDDE